MRRDEIWHRLGREGGRGWSLHIAGQVTCSCRIRGSTRHITPGMPWGCVSFYHSLIIIFRGRVIILLGRR